MHVLGKRRVGSDVFYSSVARFINTLPLPLPVMYSTEHLRGNNQFKLNFTKKVFNSHNESTTMSCQRFIEETRNAPPANLLIKFESFSLFSKSGIDMYESRPFEAGGHKWKMMIYPEGNDRCHVSVNFSILDTKSLPFGWEVNGIFAFFVYDHQLHNYLCFRGTTRPFNESFTRCGFSKMISKETLMDPRKGYLVDDSCIFGAEVLVLKSQCVTERFSLLKSTYKREWKISGFYGLGNEWNSEEFDVGNHRWKVQVFTKEPLHWQKSRHISVLVYCIDAMEFGPHQKVKAEVCARIKNKLNGTHDSFGFNNWFTSFAPNWGFSDVLSLADMSRKRYLNDGCCILEVEICVHAVVLDTPEI